MKYFFLIFFIPLLSYAENSAPLWEMGLAAGYADAPHYPTANQSKERFLIIPVFFYRGKILRSDQNDGLRARLTQDRKYQLDMSYGGSFPANSKGNVARRGMENLDWTFEIGPRLSYFFTLNKVQRFRFLTAIRPAITTNFSHTQYRGLRTVISLNHQKFHFIKDNWQSSLWASLTYINEGLSDYFFQVNQSDVTSSREAYNAKGGFLSWNVSGSLILNYGKKNFFMGLSYVNYENAVIKDSPLYRNKSNTIVFLGMSWFFYESEQKGYR